MKVYDCFPFFNELDVLEIRLEELWNTVDHFVLVESNVTFTGNSKPYVFELNQERFSKYLDKIRYIKVDDMPETNDPWVREKFQRIAAERGLTDVTEQDLIITSDCDEIPRAELIDMIKQDENNYDRYLLYVPQFNFRLNYMKIFEITKHCQIIITRFKKFTNTQQEREYTFFWNAKPDNSVMVDHGGWHFTFIGNEENSINKFKSYSHTELNSKEIIDNFNIDRMIRNKFGFEGTGSRELFEYVTIDEYFPECIVNNIERWQHLIVPNAVFRVDDLYREQDTR
jgi:Glycosyltransferase family 17